MSVKSLENLLNPSNDGELQDIIRRARDAGVQVQAIPGPCAFVTALSASGLPTDRFLFEGFLPAKGGARRKRLESLADNSETLIFYESPHRIEACLVDMAAAFSPERSAVIARELTKTFETYNTGSLAQLIECVQTDANQQRGEMVVLVAGAEQVEAEIGSEVERLMQLLVPRMPLKEAAAVGADYFGLKKNQLYRWALENL
jgi:16S rRNA (cytidine1402-2'-O)-methyltransferase